MNNLSIKRVALYAGLIAVVVGAVAFALNWLVWGGGMPGYGMLLFPGNLVLVYVWHPIFTEEIDFWPKLVLQFSGQFIVVVAFTALLTGVIKRLLPAQRP
jgi:4-hydroxybenzoate polyprenyltransferase